ncbi:MAG: hypothetical protein ACTIC1_05695 [Brevibacterium sp.]|uniref:hypothetical protein n=1 Tax=Brevibacterium aurantiacum TaxID=273384 RepID=UPI003F92BC0F
MSRVSKEEAIATTLRDIESGMWKPEGLLGILYESARIDAAIELAGEGRPAMTAHALMIDALARANAGWEFA